MRQIYPNLYIGGSTDLYMHLFVYDKPGESCLSAVLDCTPDLPTRKWLRDKHLRLKKVGFASGQAMSSHRLKVAIEYIHQFRTDNKAVLIGCRNGLHRSLLVAIAYLMVKKDLSFRDALSKVEKETDERLELPPVMVKSVQKFIQNIYKRSKPPCDCHLSEHQVCDICQVFTGYEVDCE